MLIMPFFQNEKRFIQSTSPSRLKYKIEATLKAELYFFAKIFLYGLSKLFSL